MIPRMISLKLDRQMLRAGLTLAKIAGAFVAQLSTRAANQAQVLYGYSTGRINRQEAMKELGIGDCRELFRLMMDNKLPMPRPSLNKFEALADRMVSTCLRVAAPVKRTAPKRPGIASRKARPRIKAGPHAA